MKLAASLLGPSHAPDGGCKHTLQVLMSANYGGSGMLLRGDEKVLEVVDKQTQARAAGWGKRAQSLRALLCMGSRQCARAYTSCQHRHVAACGGVCGGPYNSMLVGTLPPKFAGLAGRHAQNASSLPARPLPRLGRRL